MAITAQPGYIVDPTNPNAVIKDPNATTSLGGMTGSTSFGATNTQPIAQAPASPTPLPSSPTAPIANPAQTTTTSSTPAQQLAMPATGSVVDLLNTAGQDSSFNARSQLAQKYGIQGYTGTATQNNELSRKYLEAYNKLKTTSAPQTGAGASSTLDSYFQQNTQQPQQDPIKAFMDSFAGMNPIEANIFQQLSGLLSSTQNQQSLSDFYKQEVATQGIPGLQMELADANRIMEGTEDDIRSEITNAGGFATESQVQAMTAARNKTLLKRANYLSNVLQAKNDYVDRIVSLTQADRKQVSDDLDRKLGITKTLFDMTQTMQNNARQNYQRIVDSVGWGGLAATVQDNPNQARKIESLFGLGRGELSALAKYQKPLTAKEQIDLENAKLQGMKLKQDISQGSTVSTQVVDLNGKKVLINSKTGAVVADLSSISGGAANQFQLAQQQQTILDTNSLVKDSYLSTAVGPNPLARTSYFDTFTGGKSNFIASVEQLRQQLTKDSLINAKAAGATFGALSEGELALLAGSATKLATWAYKDSGGNIDGYRTSEESFKAELDKINNFAKLDFILKGGDPASVGVQQMADHTLWVQNSDGTFTKIN